MGAGLWREWYLQGRRMTGYQKLAALFLSSLLSLCVSAAHVVVGHHLRYGKVRVRLDFHNRPNRPGQGDLAVKVLRYSWSIHFDQVVVS